MGRKICPILVSAMTITGVYARVNGTPVESVEDLLKQGMCAEKDCAWWYEKFVPAGRNIDHSLCAEHTIKECAILRGVK